MIGDFWLLVAATVIAGYYSANGQLYRFAAAELSVPEFREKAVSLVLAGGLVGAVLGPNLASRTRNLLEVPFAGAYLSLAVVALVSMVIMAFMRFPPRAAQEGRCTHRSAAVGHHAPTGVHCGHGGRGLGLRRDEPADGRHSTGHASLRV
jgi:predicted MFS family arabinose efflux permease